MANTPQDQLRPDSGHLRLQTLVRLRWLAVAGQSLAVIGVYFGLGFPLSIGSCFALIALSAWLNIVLRLRHPASQRVSPPYATALLAYDTLQLAGLLYLTGGLANPFGILFLVPVMVSASVLPVANTILLSGLVVACAVLLMLFHQPLPWYPQTQLALPLIYIAGVFAALSASIAFMAIYAWRIAEEARQMSRALAATELVLAREQHLSALDGLAAAAAHELGTPLGTIAVVAKELLNAANPDDPHLDDVKLLKTQADRCRAILATLTSLGERGDALLARLPLEQLVEEVVAPYRHFDKIVSVSVAPSGEDGSPAPVGQRNPAILYGLGNLIENAVDFARSRVDIDARWTQDEVVITIADDGPGFAADMLQRLGEPYVTSRHSSSVSNEEFGLGLGFFIAKTLLERSGATLRASNKQGSESGAVVRLVWPRAAMNAAAPETELH